MFPIIDMHCDTISGILRAKSMGDDVALRENEMSVDLMKLSKGGYMCQNFALFTHLASVQKKGEGAFDHALALSDTLDSQLALNPDLIRPAFSGTDLEKNFEAGFLSGLKTIEEGAVYEGKVENLQKLYARGVRMSTLTWNFENELAFPNKMNVDDDGVLHAEPDTENGLKEAGFDMVCAMEEMGVIIDVSHLNDAGILDIFRTVKKETPVIASHSNARAVCNVPRNLTDEMLRLIAEHGGICGINFAYDFISEEKSETKLTTIDGMIAHMKYIQNVAGIDSIGFGSDFDGIDNPVEVRNASGMQQIADAMSLAGFTVDEIEKVFYRNALRVYKQVLG